MNNAELNGWFEQQWHYALGDYINDSSIFVWFNSHREDIDLDIEDELL